MNGRILPGLAILLAFQLAGEALAPHLPLAMPGSVTGMVLLAVALFAGWVRIDRVRGAADALLSRLGLFFVPAGVGVMAHGRLLRQEWMPIVVAMAVSTVAVLVVTGWTERWLARKRTRRAD